MKHTLNAFMLALTLATPAAAGPIFGEDQEVPPIDDTPIEIAPPVVTLPPAPPPYPNDMPRAGYPLIEPPFPVVNYPLPKRVWPWTGNGSHFLIDYAREVCRAPDTYIRCESVSRQAASPWFDWGFRIYRKDTGAYLGTIDRNVGEEIQRDYDTAVIDAENRHPESKFIARREAEKAQLEYIAAACSTGAVYCTSMASKLPDKFKTLFSAACSLWSGVCVAKITTMKLDIQKQIDFVKSQCQLGDQQCFDAVTNGGETKARLQSQAERSGGSGSGAGSGERPPHNIRPTTFGDGDPMAWYDPSCKHCKITESKPTDDY